jgi:hypothetical protein
LIVSADPGAPTDSIDETAKMTAAQSPTAVHRTTDGARESMGVASPPARGTTIAAGALQYALAYTVALPVFMLHGAVRRLRGRRGDGHQA